MPAAIAGLQLPPIAEGALAEFALARYSGDGLELEQVVAAGESVLDAPVHPRML